MREALPVGMWAPTTSSLGFQVASSLIRAYWLPSSQHDEYTVLLFRGVRTAGATEAIQESPGLYRRGPDVEIRPLMELPPAVSR